MSQYPKNWQGWQNVGAPDDQIDWNKKSWGDVVASGLQHAIPSLMGDVWGGATALGKAGLGAIQAQQARNQLSPQQQRAQLVDELRANQHAHPNQNSFQQAGQDLGGLFNGLKGYVANAYTNPGALKRTIATDPAKPVMDASALASIVGGGEGLSARVPGEARYFAQGITRGANAVATATNPFSLVPKAVSAGATAVQKGLRGNPLTASGDFTPQALGAVQRAFPNGEVSPAELADPAFKQRLTSTFQAKGISPDSVREAVLQHNGAPLSRTAATLQRPTGKARPAAADAKTDAQTAMAARADAISGGDRDDSALGDALQKAHAASQQNVSDLYETASQAKGRMTTTFPARLSDNVQSALQGNNLPSSADEFAQFPSHTESPKAFDFLNNRVGNLAANDTLTFPALDRTRQEMNALWKGADGNDAYAISTMKGALDQTVVDALKNSEIRGAMAGSQGVALQNARTANVDHINTFENPNTANPTIRSAIKPFAKSDGVPPPGATAQTNSTLLNGVINPKTLVVKPGGQRLYSDLSDILGPDGQPVLNDQIRKTALATDSGGLTADPENLRAFLASPIGVQVFTPDEQTQLRLMAAGQDVLNTRPLGDVTSLPSGVGRMARLGVGAGLGAVTGGVLGHGPMAGLTDAITGAGIEVVGEKVADRYGVKAEQAGAPAQGASLDALRTAGDAGSKIGSAAPALNAVGDAQDEAQQEQQQAVQATRDQLTKSNPWYAVGAPDGDTRFDALPSSSNSAAPVYDIGAQGSAPTTEGSVSAAPEPVPVPSASAPIAPVHDPDAEWRKYGAPADDASAPTADVPAQANGGRVARASGGKTGRDFETLVQRLMKMTETAKKAEDKATKPLLNAPDAAIIRALDVAQRAI